MKRNGMAAVLAVAAWGLLAVSGVRAQDTAGCGCGVAGDAACCNGCGAGCPAGCGATCVHEIRPITKDKRLHSTKHEEFCLQAVSIEKLFGHCCSKVHYRKQMVLHIQKCEVCCPRCKLVKPEEGCESCGQAAGAPGTVERLPAPGNFMVPPAGAPGVTPIPAPTPIPSPTPLPRGTTATYSIAPPVAGNWQAAPAR